MLFPTLDLYCIARFLRYFSISTLHAIALIAPRDEFLFCTEFVYFYLGIYGRAVVEYSQWMLNMGHNLVVKCWTCSHHETQVD